MTAPKVAPKAAQHSSLIVCDTWPAQVPVAQKEIDAAGQLLGQRLLDVLGAASRQRHSAKLPNANPANDNETEEA